MFYPKAVFCRVFQAAFRMALPILPYRETQIISSCSGIGSVLKKENVSSVLIVTDKGIVGNGLLKPVETALQTSGISYIIYEDTLPNPTVQNVEAALTVYNTTNCNGLIAIGGGSAIDCAKAVWVHTTGRLVSRHFHITNLSWIKRHGSICRCVISHIKAKFMKHYCTFS